MANTICIEHSILNTALLRTEILLKKVITFFPPLFPSQKILVVAYNYKDTITIESVELPLTVNHYYEKNQKVHVHVISYNYAAFSITSNVSTIFIIASKSTPIPHLS